MGKKFDFDYTVRIIKVFEKKIKFYNALDLLQKNYLHKGLYADLVTLILAKPTIKKYLKLFKK